MEPTDSGPWLGVEDLTQPTTVSRSTVTDARTPAVIGERELPGIKRPRRRLRLTEAGLVIDEQKPPGRKTARHRAPPQSSADPLAGSGIGAVGKVFLSYALDQAEFVSLLRRDLEKENIATKNGIDGYRWLSFLFLQDTGREVVIVVMSEAYLRSMDCMRELCEIIAKAKLSTPKVFAILPLFFDMPEWAMLEEFDERDLKDFASSWDGVSEEEQKEWLRALSTINRLEGLYHEEDGETLDMVHRVCRRMLLEDSPGDFHSGTLDEVGTGPSETLLLENKKYDVFLSFRGLDVQMFIHLLYESLSIAGLDVCFGNDRLEEDGSDHSRVEMAIKDAAVCIPIFSRNYAGSARCLQELAHMCRSNRFIVPVYYDVTPSDVRCPHRGLYAQAFKKHYGQRRYKRHTIIEWMKALNRVPTRRFLQETPGHERDLVKNVVCDVLLHLKREPLEMNCAVGLKKRMDNVIDLLEIGRDDGAMAVVIWGMGGIGKTTLAKAVYNSLLHKFDALCFISDVRMRALEKNGLCKLQGQMLRELVGTDHADVESVDDGKDRMTDCLCSTRALVMLDDVDQYEQLDALGGDWFGNGSRIIVTTRNMGIVKRRELVKTYTVTTLNTDESLQLFSWHAFGRQYPGEGYEYLSQKVVDACGGLPLALQVIGQTDVTCWTQCSMGLTGCVGFEDRLFKSLKISYDSLNNHEKQMFLDMACFFIPQGNLEAALIFWQSPGFDPSTVLSDLVQKSLLSVNDENQWQMHNLLRDMGRAIVANESEDPGKRSRLWKGDDALQVIKRSLVTESVRGISICGSDKNNIILQAEWLASMPNLQLIWLDGLASIEGDLQKLCPNLRWLHWSSCPWKCLPCEWNMEDLSILDFSSGGQGYPSSIKVLWNKHSHHQKPMGLKVLRLNSCEYLERLPDLSSYSSLSILDMEHCSEVKTLPDSIGMLHQLKYLNLSGCQNLEELPYSIGRMSSLERLVLRNCFSIRMLPNALGQLQTLKELDIRCLGLVQELPPLQKLSGLKKLDLSDCHSLRGLPLSLCELKCLQYLNMNGCCSLSCLPDDFGNLVSLEELFMNHCCRLTELPESFGNLLNLRNLEMKYNSNIMGLPASFYSLKLLVQLDASDCNLLHGFPEQIGDLSSLEILDLENNLFCSFPSSISNLARLTTLILNKCETLLELPALPEGLVEVDIGNCILLKTICDMSHLKKLKTLVICNCEHLVRLPGLGLQQSLTLLNVSRCKNVRSLGDMVGLKSLETLYLSGSGISALDLCQWMKGMPNLQELSIYANRVPEWLEYRMEDHLLKDNKCKGIIFCCVLKFLCQSNAGGLVSETPMEMIISSKHGQEFFRTKVFSNRQKVEGDQLYMCIYRENHPLIWRLASADSVCMQVKGNNIQIRHGGLQLLYEDDVCNNGTLDIFERLGQDLQMLQENYNETAGKDEFDTGEDEFQYKGGELDNDNESYEYGHAMSEDEY